MKRVVWISSVFPTEKDQFSGDFIERHAKAASLYNDITVLHVLTGDKHNYISKIYNTRLRAEIIVVPMNIFGWRWLQKIRLFIEYVAVFKKHVSRFGRPHLIHVNYVRSAGIVATWFKFRYFIQYVVTEHWSGYLFDSPNILDMFCFRNAQKVAGVSQYFSTQLQNQFGLRKVEVIPNVVDIDLFKPAYLENESFVFLHNSGEESEKKSMLIVKAFKEMLVIKEAHDLKNNQVKNLHHHYELHFFGKFRDDIAGFIISNQLQNYIFQHGLVSQEELSSFMSKSSCLVQYSSFETFGCIVAESLCCGLPTIVSDIPAMRELIKPNINGLLVQPDNILALSQAMEKMTNQYLQFNRQLIAEKARLHFTYDQVGKTINEFYKSAL